MKAACFLMALTAFGWTLGQRKAITVAPIRDSPSTHNVPDCPEKCNCTRLEQNRQSVLKKVICPKIPSSLHKNIMSLKVYNLC
jgi:hypothetical protein